MPEPDAGRPLIPPGAILLSVLRVAVVVALLVTVYWVVPVDPDSPAITAVAAAGLLAAMAVAVTFRRQVTRITRSTHPLLAGAESLVLVLATFLVGFAFVYLALATSEPESFSQPLDHTGALYFTVTVLSTVGFGDITPDSDVARIVVTLQMLIDLGLIAAALRLILNIARQADQVRQRRDPTE